ncbi:hypothetical protein SAMN04490243_1397 [Robiginitalea myxolifaciens]|uniref:TonB family C-terminal domain-containing protein n=1 Tax=Robiginitalea myxolifaciens TaxID=400055 RepID=A0A1I6G8I0_9FLAO|nr:hypothetical protein [Robiginitalea myxolifaciens]SFR38484.1 hypothetical protein SAMN04490243_1397 [Robiginitalea myxolifaciens]
MNLNRSQLAMLITGFTLGIVVLTLFNIHLGAEVEEEYVIEMALADEVLEELIRQEEELREAEAADPIKSHMAMNETAKPTFGQPEPLKTLEELMAERQMDASDSDATPGEGEYAETLKELAQKREEAKQLLGEKEAEKKEYTNYLKDKRTSITYSLVERNAYELPPPIYTCIEGGKVVINIEVDSRGFVTEASFNAKSSGTDNGCLVDNAIAYALQARFNSSGRATQKGTITYLFQSK